MDALVCVLSNLEIDILGKTSIVWNLLHGHQVEEFVGTAFDNWEYKLTHGNQMRDIVFWDFGGQEDYRRLRTHYWHECDVFIFVYSITYDHPQGPFINLESWIKEITDTLSSNPKTSEKPVKFIVVGNKADLDERRKVTYEQGAKFAKKHGVPFFEISCKTGLNVLDAVHAAVQLYMETLDVDRKALGEKAMKDGITYEKQARKLAKKNILEAEKASDLARSSYLSAIEHLTSAWVSDKKSEEGQQVSQRSQISPQGAVNGH